MSSFCQQRTCPSKPVRGGEDAKEENSNGDPDQTQSERIGILDCGELLSNRPVSIDAYGHDSLIAYLVTRCNLIVCGVLDMFAESSSVQAWRVSELEAGSLWEKDTYPTSEHQLRRNRQSDARSVIERPNHLPYPSAYSCCQSEPII